MIILKNDGSTIYIVEGREFTNEDNAVKYESGLFYNRAEKTSFHLDECIKVNSPTEFYMLANYLDLEPNFDPERVGYPTVICYTRDGLSDCNVYIPCDEFFDYCRKLVEMKDSL
jgi:hypothetical protein